jgi:hypothetical protein
VDCRFEAVLPVFADPQIGILAAADELGGVCVPDRQEFRPLPHRDRVVVHLLALVQIGQPKVNPVRCGIPRQRATVFGDGLVRATGSSNASELPAMPMTSKELRERLAALGYAP